ncbi:stalk domain-containing protein [Gorillibacterium sp. sgz5001074]|uniref:stalk domain-containing protein n=1 Tax=Gorillibacterium sp. sgz5001074 TaxID=3446695 RepID=UPI003F6746F2
MAEPPQVTPNGWFAIGSDGIAVKSDGTVWAWGGNQSGQLGNGEGGKDAAPSWVPTQVKGLSEVSAVASGQGFSLALKKDGTVWAWGSNSSGIIGDGTQTEYSAGKHEVIHNEDRYLPVQVKGVTDVAAIAADWTKCYAVKKDGTLWAWGGLYYKKSDGTYGNYRTPIQLKGFDGIISVSLGWGNMIALKKDGTVWTLSSGKATPIDGITDMTQIAAGGAYSYGLKQDGTVWQWGSNGIGKVDGQDTSDHSALRQLEGISDVASLKASAGGPLMLKRDGTVWASGRNNGGQLGIGSYENSDIPVQVKGLIRVKEINASGISFTSMAIKDDHTLWSWGHGPVGDGTEWYRTVPTWIKSYESEVLQEDQIRVNLDGRVLKFDQPPVIVDDTTMIPLRKIFEEMGASIEWNSDTSTVSATRGETIIRLTEGSKEAYLNGASISLRTAPVIVNGSTLVPARFIAESLGAIVSWEEASLTVFIKTGDSHRR